MSKSFRDSKHTELIMHISTMGHIERNIAVVNLLIISLIVGFALRHFFGVFFKSPLPTMVFTHSGAPTIERHLRTILSHRRR